MYTILQLLHPISSKEKPNLPLHTAHPGTLPGIVSQVTEISKIPKNGTSSIKSVASCFVTLCSCLLGQNIWQAVLNLRYNMMFALRRMLFNFGFTLSRRNKQQSVQCFARLPVKNYRPLRRDSNLRFLLSRPLNH